MKNLHGIEVKFLGPTNTRGGRVRITSCRLEESVVIPYNYALNSIAEVAQAYLEQKGLNVVAIVETKNGYMLLSDTFQNIK